MSSSDQVRTYTRTESDVFLKTAEPLGGLSNMAGGYPIRVNGIRILTSEALYQACRFPHLPEVQAEIIAQKSPMTAKMKSKPRRRDSRPDWDNVRVKVMRWCLRVKLAQNWGSFSRLLLETGDRPIVEQSRRDTFWGAKPVDDRTLVGMNVLGRLLMEIRELAKSEDRESLLRVQPIEISDFRLAGRLIEVVTAPSVEPPDMAEHSGGPSTAHGIQTSGLQGSLFDRPESQEALRGRAAASWIIGLKPYPAMKDSGVEWLGEVPEHWEIDRLKSSVSNVIEQTAERQGGDLYVALEHVESWTGRLRQADSDVTFDSQVKRFLAGDVLFGKLRPYLAKVTRPTNGGVCVGEFLVLRPHGSGGSAPYLEQLLRSKPVIDAVNSSTFGAKMPRADWRFLGSMAISLPPLPEQTAIVRFLDHADRRIRRYIRAKQKLIKLLEEQEQAIIHRAVTRGLDPNVRLKPSGVEWLGDVPEHWEVVPFTRIATERADYRGATPAKTESGVFLVTAKNVRKGWIDYELSKEFVAAEDYAAIMRRGLPKRDDLLLTMEAPLGHAALVDREHIALAQRVVRFRFDRGRVEPDFILQSVLSPYFQNQILSRGTGSTAMGIKASKLPQLQLLVPPLPEQIAVLNWIDQECKPTAVAARQAQSEISLLREYRTRLIADVVTGKLDVREAAARLPDEVEEPESLDEIEAEGDTDAVPEEAEA